MKKRLAIILLLSMIFCISCQKKPEPEIQDNLAAAQETAAEEKEDEAVSTYVFLGSDTRDPAEKGRSDVIMLTQIDDENKTIKLVSVYRDTLMDINGLSKCNAAYSHGGGAEAVDMLERNLDLSIDGYVSGNFLSVINAIDAVGGIDMYVTGEEAYFANSYVKAMNKLYEKNSPDLIAGDQHLDGLQAVAYARVRYTEGWDYKRTERQRTVLELLMEKLKNMSEHERITIILELLSEVGTDIDQTQLVNTADAIINYKVVESCGFPEYKKGKSFSDLGDCVVPNDLTKNVKWLHEEIFNEKDYQPSKEVERINTMINNVAK